MSQVDREITKAMTDGMVAMSLLKGEVDRLKAALDEAARLLGVDHDSDPDFADCDACAFLAKLKRDRSDPGVAP